ncbi:MAG TPA: GtrA family protein [Dysgonamonadaceae bacterium]|nr:GtrA family protein [Dysgonamonadaceae bacterium]HPD42741.1 GtrA family protein [Dysgonamonadaceae bacterium]HRS41228.1 GtrA family protein [Dysgonamonadaceae bacterium]
MRKQILTFSKAQFSALAGGLLDYGTMIFVTEVFHIHYTIGIVIGGILGALVNFFLNKKWTFNSENESYQSSLPKQLLKFTVTALNSIFLKSYGTFILTTVLVLDYKITRIMVDLIVSIFFNYTLQKQWVFKKCSIETRTNTNKFDFMQD